MESHKKIELACLQKDDVFVIDEPKHGLKQKVYVVEEVNYLLEGVAYKIDAVSGVEDFMFTSGEPPYFVYLINAGDKHSENRFREFEIEKMQSLIKELSEKERELKNTLNKLLSERLSGLYYDTVGKVISFENDACDSCVMIVNEVTENHVKGKCIAFDPESNYASFMPDYTVAKSYLFYEGGCEVSDYTHWLSVISKIFNVEVREV